MNLFSLGGWLWETLNGLFLVICDLLYRLISALYEVFDAVAKVNLFSEDIFNKFTSRIYIVMGIAMLFIFAYNIILLIVNPDNKKSTGSTTKLVKDTLISLVLVVFMPTIFRYMTILQNDILDSQIIAKVILAADNGAGIGGTSYDEHCNFSSYNLDDYSERKRFLFWGYNTTDNVTTVLSGLCNNFKGKTESVKGAYSIPALLMQTFYRPNNFTFQQCQEYLEGNTSLITDAEDQKICVNYFFDVNSARYTGGVTHFVNDGFLKNIVSDESKDKMVFEWLTAIVAGGLAVWMFLCYAMAIGVRVAKLGVLQLVAPIPVMLRILPKKGSDIFNKWYKHLLETYLDVFIRLAIIYFALFAVSLVPEVLDNLFASLWLGGTSNWFIKGLATVIVILGILQFAKDVPNLMKEFFGSSGRFALKSPSQQIRDNKYAMGAMGAVGGMATGAVKNIGKGNVLAGATSGLFRGAKAGYGSKTFKGLKKNISNVGDQVVQARDARDLRQKYDEEHGFLASRRRDIKDSWNAWRSSDSYASLSAKSNNVGKMQKAYDDILKLVEGKIDELPDAFMFDGKSYGYYKREADNAIAAHENFDAYKYAQEYRETHKGVSPEEAMKAAENEKVRLNLAAGAAKENARLVREALADAVIAERGGGANGIASRDIKIDGMQTVSVDDNGIASIEKAIKEGAASTSKEVKGVAEKVDEANSLYEKNSVMLRDDTRKDIDKHRDDVRKNNGALKGELNHISSEIAKLSELKGDDKK